MLISETHPDTVQVSRVWSFGRADNRCEALEKGEGGLTGGRPGLRFPGCLRSPPLRRSAALPCRHALLPGLQRTWGSQSRPS